MSFTRKIIDGARSGLNSVLEKISMDDEPLSHVDGELLQREVERRRAARRAAPASPTDNPRARVASASPQARAQRASAAKQRAARIHAARGERERAARQAQEAAFRRAKEQAQRGAGSQRGSASGGASGGHRGAGRMPFGRKEEQLAAYYKTLDLPYGASLDEVKKAYRQLMRKYHPDRHVGNPKKQKAATELSMRVSQAYKGLEEHFRAKGS